MNAENVKISGKVIDSEDKPVEFATVRVAGTAIGANTNLQGQYSISVARKDTLELVFSCVGFKTVNHKLINPKGDLTLNVRMYSNDVELKELEVLGFKSNINGMQSFNTESFKLSPDVSGGSVEAMISTMPGVNSSNELSSQYSVRGGSFDENSVYINGIEIYRPQLVRSGQQEGLSIINPDMVGNLKFSSGGFPARYDDKMSSALDITYREPEAFEGAVSASLMGASLTLGQNSGKFSQLHGLRFKKNNSLLSSMDTKGEYDPTYFDYQTNLNLKPSDRWTFNLLGNISLNHYNFTPHNRETTFGTAQDVKHFKVYFDGQERDKFETFLGALTALYRPNRASSFMIGASGFLTNELVSYDISGEYWLNQAGTGGEDGIGGELGVGKYMEHSRNRLKASVFRMFLKGETRIKANNLTYGLDYRRETFRDRTKEWEWRDSAGYSLPTLPEGVHLIYSLSSNHNLSTNRLGAYIEDAYYIDTEKARMTLNGGLRFSYWDFNKEFLVSPRVNFSLSPIGSSFNFRAAAGLYYQSPFYKEFRRAVTDENGNNLIELNRDIKSPRSIHVILGTDYTFRAMNRPFKLTGEVYYKNIANFISYEYDNLKINYSGVNDSKGYVAGLDMKLFGQFVEGSDSWLSFSLMKTNQNLNGKNVPLPSDQRFSVSLYFTDYFPKFPKLKFSLRGVFADGLTMTAPHRSRAESYFRAPAYKRVDIGVSYQLVGAPTNGVRPYNFWRHFRSIVVGLDCFNLLDITNVSSYYWVTDVNNIQYAVPNYLTRRQLNVRLSVEF
ncbi:MAG: TonB-dependent receptor [Muribaculaceae bacterium]|nr:TonB-dependent receptor [Muribaculaceae bacterium]